MAYSHRPLDYDELGIGPFAYLKDAKAALERCFEVAGKSMLGLKGEYVCTKPSCVEVRQDLKDAHETARLILEIINSHAPVLNAVANVLNYRMHNHNTGKYDQGFVDVVSELNHKFLDHLGREAIKTIKDISNAKTY